MPPPDRKPWPMKWVALAIFLCLGAYTWMTLHYRKDNAFNPYADMKNQAQVMRLLDGGFQRVVLQAERPADPKNTGYKVLQAAAAHKIAGGIPAALDNLLIDKPIIPESFKTPNVPATAISIAPLVIQFTCLMPDNHWQFAGATLYRRGKQITLINQFETLEGALLARNRECLVTATIPASHLEPGTYDVTLIGSKESYTWSLQVH